MNITKTKRKCIHCGEEPQEGSNYCEDCWENHVMKKKKSIFVDTKNFLIAEKTKNGKLKPTDPDGFEFFLESDVDDALDDLNIEFPDKVFVKCRCIYEEL